MLKKKKFLQHNSKLELSYPEVKDSLFKSISQKESNHVMKIESYYYLYSLLPGKQTQNNYWKGGR